MSTLMKFFVIALVASSISLFNSTIYAVPGQSQGKGKGHGAHHKSPKSMGVKSNKIRGPKNLARFSTNDRTTITRFFDNDTSFSTKALPPGIAMNVARGKPLPPGIAKRYLPSNLISQLPVYPGYEYLVVGRDVVLVDRTSNIVADIISNVLR